MNNQHDAPHSGFKAGDRVRWYQPPLCEGTVLKNNGGLCKVQWDTGEVRRDTPDKLRHSDRPKDAADRLSVSLAARLLPDAGQCTDAMANAMARLDGYDRDPDMPGLQRWKDYWDAAVTAAPTPPAPSGLVDDGLPCEVMVAPSTRFGQGVAISTVLAAIERRRDRPTHQRMFPEWNVAKMAEIASQPTADDLGTLTGNTRPFPNAPLDHDASSTMSQPRSSTSTAAEPVATKNGSDGLSTFERWHIEKLVREWMTGSGFVPAVKPHLIDGLVHSLRLRLDRADDATLSGQQGGADEAPQSAAIVADIVNFPGALRVSGVARISPNKLEVEFGRAVTDDQFINFWLAIKSITVASVRPKGWEPSDKSDAEKWEPA
jgi:hypothetical protein